MPVDIRSYPRTDFGNLQITGASASAQLGQKSCESIVPTIPTSAGTTAVSMIAPITGTLTAAKFVAKDTLAVDTTNIITFALVNKTTGGGSTAMLAATAANTTTTTTGTALTAYTTRTLTLSGTGSNLAVVAGHCLEFQVTGSGTLANTVTQGHVQLIFSGTT